MIEVIKEIVERGGNVEITDGAIPVDVIKSVITTAAMTGAQVTIDASTYPTEILLQLVRIGGGNVTVRFE